MSYYLRSNNYPSLISLPILYILLIYNPRDANSAALSISQLVKSAV